MLPTAHDNTQVDIGTVFVGISEYRAAGSSCQKPAVRCYGNGLLHGYPEGRPIASSVLSVTSASVETMGDMARPGSCAAPRCVVAESRLVPRHEIDDVVGYNSWLGSIQVPGATPADRMTLGSPRRKRVKN